jgi:hypothetical protein
MDRDKYLEGTGISIWKEISASIFRVDFTFLPVHGA